MDPNRSTSTNGSVDKQKPKQPTRAVTDSPLFWVPIFIAGALLALFLTGPKYSWRQPQLERMSRARELSGQAVASTRGGDHLPQTGEAAITLKPLIVFFWSALFVCTIGYWWWRFSGRHHFGNPIDDVHLRRSASHDSKEGID